MNVLNIFEHFAGKKLPVLFLNKVRFDIFNTNIRHVPRSWQTQKPLFYLPPAWNVALKWLFSLCLVDKIHFNECCRIHHQCVKNLIKWDKLKCLKILSVKPFKIHTGCHKIIDTMSTLTLGLQRQASFMTQKKRPSFTAGSKWRQTVNRLSIDINPPLYPDEAERLLGVCFTATLYRLYFPSFTALNQNSEK